MLFLEFYHKIGSDRFLEFLYKLLSVDVCVNKVAVCIPKDPKTEQIILHIGIERPFFAEFFLIRK